MKMKVPKKSHVIITGIILLIFSIFFLYLISQNKVLADMKNTNVILQVNALSTGLPMRLKIPSISLDTFVEHVGINSFGEMDTPKNIENVAWFESGVLPGEIGSAVIDGHYGWKNNKPAAFDNLSKVKIGETISVENDKGVITTFLVRDIKQYEPGIDTTTIFTSNDGVSHLNLITCAGVWNKIDKNYSKRLVIFADKEIR